MIDSNRHFMEVKKILIIEIENGIFMSTSKMQKNVHWTRPKGIKYII